jgi:hypothetical protein
MDAMARYSRKEDEAAGLTDWTTGKGAFANVSGFVALMIFIGVVLLIIAVAIAIAVIRPSPLPGL